MIELNALYFCVYLKYDKFTCQMRSLKATFRHGKVDKSDDSF